MKKEEKEKLVFAQVDKFLLEFQRFNDNIERFLSKFEDKCITIKIRCEK
jgi:hypothetical protein